VITRPLTASLRTRDRILKAAQRLIATRGADACTTRAVATAAGITAGAIYRHFASRDELVGHAVELALESFERHLLDAIISLPVGSFARVAALGTAYVQFAQQHEEEFRVLFMPVGRARSGLGEVFAKSAYPILRRCVVEAMASGEIREADPDTVALFVWTRVHGIVTLFMGCDVEAVIEASEKIDPAAFFEQTGVLVRDGLRRPDSYRE
jgi:AcrR family transcriptional regulator